MPYFLRIPKVQLILSLFIIFLTTMIYYPAKDSLILLSISLLSVIFFDLLFTRLRKNESFMPWAAIATGLIITLIIDPKAEWYQIMITCGIAMGIKNFVRFSERHIFNPAESGLLVAGLLFNQYVSWWGVSFQNITANFSLRTLVLFFILLLPFLISGYRMRRYKAILTFIVTYTIFTH